MNSNGHLRFWGSLLLAAVAGGTAGLGVVFHDGKSWTEGLGIGAGIGLFCFVMVYVRPLRRIAEFLSILR